MTNWPTHSAVGQVDEEIIASARNGDPDALAAIYRQHGPPLMRLAWWLTGTREDAEDVLHDVFLGLPEALDRYDERGRFAAWLARITSRVALSRVRRQRHVVSMPEIDTATADQELTDRLTLDRAVAKLPSRLRTVFVLKVVEGYSHAEIANLLQIKVNASQVRLSRAVKRLRAMLIEE